MGETEAVYVPGVMVGGAGAGPQVMVSPLAAMTGTKTLGVAEAEESLHLDAATEKRDIPPLTVTLNVELTAMEEGVTEVIVRYVKRLAVDVTCGFSFPSKESCTYADVTASDG